MSEMFIERLIRERDDLAAYRETPFPKVSLADMDKILRAILDSSAETFLEIGTHHGGTTSFLHEALPPNVLLYTIDAPDDELPKVTQEMATMQLEGEERVTREEIGSLISEVCPAYPDGRVVQLYGDSHSLESYPPGFRVDAVFIDGSHRYEDVIADTLVALHFGSERLSIVWHDAHLETDPNDGSPLVRPALQFLAKTLPIIEFERTICAFYSRMSWLAEQFIRVDGAFPLR